MKENKWIIWQWSSLSGLHINELSGIFMETLNCISSQKGSSRMEVSKSLIVLLFKHLEFDHLPQIRPRHISYSLKCRSLDCLHMKDCLTVCLLEQSIQPVLSPQAYLCCPPPQYSAPPGGFLLFLRPLWRRTCGRVCLPHGSRRFALELIGPRPVSRADRRDLMVDSAPGLHLVAP